MSMTEEDVVSQFRIMFLGATVQDIFLGNDGKTLTVLFKDGTSIRTSAITHNGSPELQTEKGRWRTINGNLETEFAPLEVCDYTQDFEPVVCPTCGEERNLHQLVTDFSRPIDGYECPGDCPGKFSQGEGPCRMSP